MANKYLIHGATYCGDGTSPNPAAADGGIGAWNNINVFEGTAPAYGTLAAGDTVYIRSKDADGNDITRTLTASVSLGSTVATADNQISWVIDNSGTVWPGVTGVITYIYFVTSGYSITMLANNRIIADVQDGLVLKNTNANGTESQLIVCRGYAKNIMHDLTQVTGTYNYKNSFTLGSNACVENLHYKRYKSSAYANTMGVIMPAAESGVFTLINPQIEILNYGGGCAIFFIGNNYTQCMRVIGGRLFGNGVTSGQVLVAAESATSSGTSHKLEIRGFDFPNTVDVVNSSYQPIGYRTNIDITGIDNGAGAHFEAGWGFVTSRAKNYPPTLSSELPDGAHTKWAWRMYPRNTAVGNPGTLDMCMYYQDADAQRTISLEFLAESGMTPKKSNTWIDVAYTDANGIQRVDSSRDVLSSASCDSSDAVWSSLTWGISSFSRYKVSLQTSYQIKQGTLITLKFNTELKSANALQVLFINGEFTVA